MRYNYSDEVSKKLVELELKNRKEMLGMYDDIINVMSKFDGKQFTKRVDTALKKINPNIRAKLEYNSFIIDYYFSDRGITYKEDGKEYANCAYLKNTSEHFAHMCCHSSYDDGVFDYGDVHETINFERVKEQLNKHREYMQKSVIEIETELARVDEVIKEYEELKTKCDEFNRKTNWCISEYYDIRRFRTE